MACFLEYKNATLFYLFASVDILGDFTGDVFYSITDGLFDIVLACRYIYLGGGKCHGGNGNMSHILCFGGIIFDNNYNLALYLCNWGRSRDMIIF